MTEAVTSITSFLIGDVNHERPNGALATDAANGDGAASLSSGGGSRQFHSDATQGAEVGQKPTSARSLTLVGSSPGSRHRRDLSEGQLRARGRHGPHSITSSARANTLGGMVRLSAFAVLRLMTSEYLEACSTGRSAGFVPLKILSM